jgi:serine/threonine protein phosphatase PrpC
MGSGCTANVVLVTDDYIYCANAGDSRAIAYLSNKSVYPLSRDHKP